MDHIAIRRAGFTEVAAYESIPIAYEVRERLDLVELARGRLTALPCKPYLKDYDAVVSERPSSLSMRYDVSGWSMLFAEVGTEFAGGAIVAPAGYDIGVGTAVLVDLRVAPKFRGNGIGRRLLQAALEVAAPLWVETQDTNVPACRLYASLGGQAVEIAPGGYGDKIGEARIIWRLDSGHGS